MVDHNAISIRILWLTHLKVLLEETLVVHQLVVLHHLGAVDALQFGLQQQSETGHAYFKDQDDQRFQDG